MNRNLQMRLRPLAETMRQQSAQEFWPGRFLKRFKIFAEKAMLIDSEGILPIKAPDFIQKASFRNIPPYQMWLAYFPHGNLQEEPQLVSGQGLVTKDRFFFAGLLHEIAKRQSGLPNTLDSPTWNGRMTGVFGFAVESLFFYENFQGSPFPVIFNKKYRYCVWNTILRAGKIVAVALVLIDMEPDRKDIGIKNLLANWNLRGIYPAFIQFPLDFGKTRYKVLMHPKLRESEPRDIINSLRNRMKIVPPNLKTKTDTIGKVRLPFSQIGKVIKKGKWQYMLVGMSQECRCLGLLLCRNPGKTISFAFQLARIWGIFIMIFWGGIFLFFKMNGRFPGIGVRDTLILWFFLLISVPVILGVNTSVSLFRDREKNLTEYQKRSVADALADIDSGSGRIIPQQERDFQALFHSPEVIAEIDSFKEKKADPEVFLSSMCQRISKLGVVPGTFIIFGPGGFMIKKQLPIFAQLNRENLLQLLKMSWWDSIEEMTESSASGSSGIGAPNIGLLKLTNRHAFNIPEKVARFWVGDLRFMFFNTRLRRNGKVAYSVGLLWENDPANYKYLQEQVPSIPSVGNSMDLAAFKKTPAGLELVGVRGKPSGMEKLAQEAFDIPISKIQSSKVSIAYPSMRLQNYVLVGRESLEKVFLETRYLAIFLGILGLAAFLLFALTIFALSRNLALPIVQMSNGLKTIAQGDLTIEVGEPRSDELGEAGLILDQMTASLRERRWLTSFVPRQVLEIISQGDIQRIWGGQKQNISVLVSDMRNFTTISETFPPILVFKALNQHLSAMTQTIQNFGGIIDRFVGDAIIAVFHPSPGAHHALRAVQAAFKMMENHRLLQKDRLAKGLFGYSIGIGIDIGEVVTGITGTEDVRLDLTALGDPLVQANHLETLSKMGKMSHIVVSSNIRRLVEPHFTFQPLAEAWELDQLSQEPVLENSDVNLEQNNPRTHASQPQSHNVSMKEVKKGRFFLPAWLAIGLWLIPILIISLGLDNVKKANDQRREEKIRQLLLDDQKYFEKALDPEFCRTLALSQSVQKTQEQAKPASDPSPVLLQTIQKEFEKPFPDHPYASQVAILASLETDGTIHDLEILRREYEGRGGSLAAITCDSPPKILVSSPQFSFPKNLDNLPKEMKSVIPSQNDQIRILISRQLLENPNIDPVKFWGYFLSFLWIIGGLSFLLLVYYFGWDPAFSLRIQMGGIFLISILPILMLAFLIIERSHIEFEARLENDALNNLEETCQSVDSGFRICQGFSQALLSHQFLKTGFLRELDNIEKKNPLARREYFPAIKKVFENVNLMGVRIRDMTLFTIFMDYLDHPFFNSETRKNPAIKFLAFIFHSNVRALSTKEIIIPDNHPLKMKPSELIVMGTQIEELQKLAFFILGPKNLLKMLQSPYYFGDFILKQDYSESLFRHSIRMNGIPRFDLHAHWLPPNLEQHLFEDWHSELDSLHQEIPISLSFAEKTNPSSFLIPPFFTFPENSTKFHSNPLPIDLIPFSRLSATSKEFLRVYFPNREEERIIQFSPGLLLDHWLIIGELDISKLFEPIVEGTRQKRLLLFLIILICILLSGKVTERFLTPINELRSAANSITRGNYKSRMQEDFAGEFGILAAAFNKMAAEAQEGKLLGQFVSESARMAAKLSHRDEITLQGEHQDVVVLFSALGGFKEALNLYSPSDLIDKLNHFLQTMSPIIRQHGGEIDKFIGDKILAVFRPPPGALPENVALNALLAAIEMQKAVSKIQASFHMRLGIGLVAGPVLAGILGAEQIRLEYTVIGDTVNLASRLSDIAAAQHSGATIIDERMNQGLKDLPPNIGQIRALATTKVRGKQREVSIFQVISPMT
ncbi:MAG: HAMP domain-containing protein [Candidatus Riflebacteria bacterium]|nr:HAMP domain-containing protein [Candidatus Riflebacteria bacterium]